MSGLIAGWLPDRPLPPVRYSPPALRRPRHRPPVDILGAQREQNRQQGEAFRQEAGVHEQSMLEQKAKADQARAALPPALRRPRHRPPVDLRGRRFGSLVAREPGPRVDGRTAWWCDCDCGRRALVRTGHLYDGGDVTSCGRLHRGGLHAALPWWVC